MSMEINTLKNKIEVLSSLQKQKKPNNTRATKESPYSGKKNKQLVKACQDFEAIFISHLLKTMRTSLGEETGFWGNGIGGGFFRDLFETEVARKVSEERGIGLAKMLYENLGKSIQASNDESSVSGLKNIGLINGGDFISLRARGLREIVNRNLAVLRLSKDKVFQKVQAFHEHIMQAVHKFNVDPALLYAVISQESGGDPTLVSSKGAKGLMQLMDVTAKEVGVQNSFDPAENIMGGTCYLRKMLGRFGGDIRLALAAYNAGPGAVEKYGGIPPYEETQNYVDNVLEYYNHYRREVKGINNDPG